MGDNDDGDDLQPTNFHEMELDDRILKAVARLGWSEPTLVQLRAIPLLLDSRDMLMRARTGSGKTAAFSLPLVQSILVAKRVVTYQAVRGLVLAPTKELCKQIASDISGITAHCSRDVRCVDISSEMELSELKLLLTSQPDIVVATPARALEAMTAKALALGRLQVLVVDEADLVFSFGHQDELHTLLSRLPDSKQTVLCSATLSDDVVALRASSMRNPVTLRLEEPALAPAGQLAHFRLAAQEEEKATVLYTLLKLNLVRGKTLVFVNNVNKCYKLKLYLEQFGIGSCLLNSELPSASRCHAIQQFNSGKYDIIVASDERALEDPSKQPGRGGEGWQDRDEESGVSRGIDFQRVSNVINFDFPLDVESYVHRVGRTARGTSKGTALSFISCKEQKVLNQVELHLRAGYNSEAPVIQKYEFNMDEAEGFRYRSRDAWRAVTRTAIREARLTEIKSEILNSTKLKTFFAKNPGDLATLRHDRAIGAVRVQPHLRNVPDYIVPETLRSLAVLADRKKKLRGYDRAAAARPCNVQKRTAVEAADPLKTQGKRGGKRGRRR